MDVATGMDAYLEKTLTGRVYGMNGMMKIYFLNSKEQIDEYIRKKQRDDYHN